MNSLLTFHAVVLGFESLVAHSASASQGDLRVFLVEVMRQVFICFGEVKPTVSTLEIFVGRLLYILKMVCGLLYSVYNNFLVSIIQ